MEREREGGRERDREGVRDGGHSLEAGARGERVHVLCFDTVSGWINTLVGGQKHGAKGFMFFIVNVDLSKEGIGKLE